MLSQSWVPHSRSPSCTCKIRHHGFYHPAKSQLGFRFMFPSHKFKFFIIFIKWEASWNSTFISTGCVKCALNGNFTEATFADMHLFNRLMCHQKLSNSCRIKSVHDQTKTCVWTRLRLNYCKKCWNKCREAKSWTMHLNRGSPEVNISQTIEISEIQSQLLIKWETTEQQRSPMHAWKRSLTLDGCSIFHVYNLK